MSSSTSSKPDPEQQTSEAKTEENPSNAVTYVKWGLVALGVAAAAFLFWYFDLRGKFQTYFTTVIQPWIDRHPITGPLAYMGIYIVAVVAFLPGSVLTLPGGALFGWFFGTILVSVASTTGAACAFLIARYAGKDWVEKKAGERLEKLQAGIKEHGGRFVAFTRLVPIFPFNLLNYMFGLTRISFWRYVLISWVAMIPGTFGYVYAGYAAKVAAASGKGIKKTMVIISIAVGVLILLSFLPKWLKRKAPEELEVDENENENDENNQENNPNETN